MKGPNVSKTIFKISHRNVNFRFKKDPGMTSPYSDVSETSGYTNVAILMDTPEGKTKANWVKKKKNLQVLLLSSK